MTAYGGAPPTPPTQPGAPGYYTPQPGISFDVFGQAFEMFKAQMSAWLMAMGMCAVIGIVYYVIGVFAILAPMLATGSRNGAVAGAGILMTLVMELVFALVGMILATALMGGLYRMAIKQVRGETISFNDVLSAKDVIGPLILASIIVSILTMAGGIACGVGSLVVGGVLMFTIPLVVDQRLPAMDAVRQSYELLKKDWLMATAFYLLAALIGELGFVACGVGILATFPIFILSIAITYRNYMTGGMQPAVPGTGPIVPGVYTPTPPAAYVPPTVETPAPSGYAPSSDVTPSAPMTGYAPPAPQPAPPAPDLNGSYNPTMDNNHPTLRTDSENNNPPPQA